MANGRAIIKVFMGDRNMKASHWHYMWMPIYNLYCIIYLMNIKTIKAALMKYINWDKIALNKNYNLQENKPNKFNVRNKMMG